MATNVKRTIPALTLEEEEQEVLNIENRRTSAESALQATAIANSTLQQKMVKVQSDIDLGLKTIEINNSEIEKIKKAIVDLQVLQAEEIKKFDELKKNNSSVIEALSVNINAKKEERAKLESSISEIAKKGEVDRLAKLQEVKVLEDSKTPIIAKVSELELQKALLLKQIELEEENLKKVNSEVDNRIVVKGNLEANIRSAQNELAGHQVVIEKNKITIESSSNQIKSKEDALVELDKKIEAKEAEYKSLEGKAFGILHREEALNQKEAFIKSQYARAGIEYGE